MKLNILIKTMRPRKGLTARFELVIAKGLQICRHPAARFQNIFEPSGRPMSGGLTHRWSSLGLPSMLWKRHRGLNPLAPANYTSQIRHWHKVCSGPVELSLDGTHVAHSAYTRVHRLPHTYDPTVLNKAKVSIAGLLWNLNSPWVGKHV